MDDNRFDDLGRALAKLSTRRDALRALAGSALAILSGVPAADALAKSKGKGKGKGKGKNKKSGCPKAPCPAGFHRDKRTCQCDCTRTPCQGGKEFDSVSCRCKCPSGLRECRDGCVGKDECCPGDPPCPEDAKGCCHAPGLDVCTIDGCCRELDGMKACNNFCVDTNSNANHCGDCNVRCAPGAACLDGACVLPEACPDGRICPGRTAPFCRKPGVECCGDKECGLSQVCCNPDEDRCCPAGRCVEGRCCPDELEVCGGACCQSDETCCGGVCCRGSNCIHGSCCEDPCGDIGASTRICPATSETCCQTADDAVGSGNRGFACPASAPRCGGIGTCCPVDKFYSPSCNACCPANDFQCTGCVGLTTGRT